jgi:predicted metal-dependent hydrolase
MMEAIQGPLWEGVLPSVLRHLYVGRRTGRLSFLRDVERHSVRFRNGHIVNADTNVREDRMGELLVRQGRLTPADLKRALDLALRDKKRLGVILMGLGLLDAQGLEEAVAAHVRHVLGKVFSWNEGSYTFTEEAPEAAQEGDVTLRLSTGELILQAARSVRDPDVVRYNLGDLDRPLALSNDPLLRFQRINLSPVDGYVLSRVDGSLSAHEVNLLIPLPAEQVQRSLFGLLSTGVVDFLPGPPRPRPAAADGPRGVPAPPPSRSEPAESPAPLPEVPTPAEAEPAAASAKPTEEPPSSLPGPETTRLPPVREPPLEKTPVLRPLPEPSLEATRILPPLSRSTAEDTGPLPPVDTRRLEVLEAHAGLGHASHFDLLGVPRDATEAQVREAYFRLAKRFHPDVHHDPALSDLREQLEQIFVRLGEAYEVLCHPRLRDRYERELARKGDAMASYAALAQDLGRNADAAKEAIRKGEESVARERYWEAIRLLESAIPRAEGEVKQRGRILLARAYARTTGWVKQGEELLLTVLQEEPNNAEALVQLARIFRGQGLRSRAITTLRRVLGIHPDHEEARAQIAELDPDWEPAVGKGPGLVQKLFGKKPG